MRLPVRLASRYIVKRRSGTLVHLISGISVTVIASVAAAMVCILSAFNGIEDLVKDLFGTLDADLAVVPASGAVVPEAWGEFLNDVPGVAAWAPVLEDEVVVRADEAVRVATVLGVQDRYRTVSHIDRAIVEGAYAVGDTGTAFPCACLGLGVRSELSLRSDVLDPPLFSVSAPIRGKKLARHRERAFRTQGMHACGTFSINADLDTRYLLLPLQEAQTLLDRNGKVSRFEIQAAPGWSQDDVAAAVMEAWQEALGSEASQATTLTRDEKHKFITQTNRAEKWATFAILSFILIVAAFNIMASLTMLSDRQKARLGCASRHGHACADDGASIWPSRTDHQCGGRRGGHRIGKLACDGPSDVRMASATGLGRAGVPRSVGPLGRGGHLGRGGGHWGAGIFRHGAALDPTPNVSRKHVIAEAL